MMTDGDVTARESPGTIPSLCDNVPGQTAMVAFLEAQAAVVPRAAFARFFGATPLSPATRLLYRAVIGEVQVGSSLAELDQEWKVVHALPVGADGVDIDHLVIGPGGVFIVNTANYSGQNVWASQRTFVVSGIRHPHVRNMEYEMGRVERLLTAGVGEPVEVSGVLAVVTPKTLTVRQPHRDVAVVSSTALVSWLAARRTVLPPETVRAINDAARLESTWHPSDSPAENGAVVRERFDRVHNRVNKAWRLQVAWVAILTIVGAGGFVLLTYTIFLNALAGSR